MVIWTENINSEYCWGNIISSCWGISNEHFIVGRGFEREKRCRNLGLIFSTIWVYVAHSGKEMHHFDFFNLQMVKIVMHHGGRVEFLKSDYIGGQISDLGDLDPDYISVTLLWTLLKTVMNYADAVV